MTSIEEAEEIFEAMEESFAQMSENEQGYRCPECDTLIKASNYIMDMEQPETAEIICHGCGEEQEVRTPWGKILDGDTREIAGELGEKIADSGPADDERRERCPECGVFIKEDNYEVHEDGKAASIHCHDCGHQDTVLTFAGRDIEDNVFFQANPKAQQTMERIDEKREGELSIHVKGDNSGLNLECDKCGTPAGTDENEWGIWRTTDDVAYCPEHFVEVVKGEGKEPKYRAGRVWLEYRDELETYDDLEDLLHELPQGKED